MCKSKFNRLRYFFWSVMLVLSIRAFSFVQKILHISYTKSREYLQYLNTKVKTLCHLLYAKIKASFHNWEAGAKSIRKNRSIRSYHGPAFDALSIGIALFSISVELWSNEDLKDGSNIIAYGLFGSSCICMSLMVIPKIGKWATDALDTWPSREIVLSTIFVFFAISTIMEWVDAIPDLSGTPKDVVNWGATIWLVLFFLIAVNRLSWIFAITWIFIFFGTGTWNLITSDNQATGILEIALGVASIAVVTGYLPLHNKFRL